MRSFPFIHDLTQWKKKNRLNNDVKVFIVTGGYGDFKKALRRRGWVQNPDYSSVCFDLKFTLQSKQIQFSSLMDFQLVNHYQKNSYLTTKVGLCRSLKNVLWYNSQDINQFYPRCYDLTDQDDHDAFIQQFKLCKCIAILKKYVRLARGGGTIDQQFGSKANISLTVLKRKMIDFDQLIDVKKNILITQKQWKQLIDDQVTAQQIAKKKYQAYLSQIQGKMNKKKKKKKNQKNQDLSGQHNIWILKPAGLSRGRGIQCLNTIAQIQDHLKYKQSQWVIQKYIQNPLIVMGRKFDIRLWVVTTDFNPLTIWVYDRCYIRFGSVDYDAQQVSNKFIHLTNNSINAKNKNADDTIKGNMWFQQQFIQHIKQIQGHDIFNQRIRPDMQRIIKLSLMSAQQSIQNRKLTHQMFGYDFMIDQNYNTWLIQINSSPAMDYSTHVTKQLVKQGLTDLVKVIVDWQFASKKQRKNIDTGGFKRIFKGVQVQQRRMGAVGLNLMLQGKAMKKHNQRAPKVQNIQFNITK